jgi:DNA-binding CsgD family transcriptional regulator
VPVRLARAEACWLDGRPGPALRELARADAGPAADNPWHRGAVAVWLRRLGPPDPPPGRDDRAPRVELAPPYVAHLAGDWTAAARIWTDLGCPFDAAMALLDAPDDTHLRRALRIFSDLGAAAAARITRQKMRRLGIRSIPTGPHGLTRAHPLGLTRREREVLTLLCGGHTNADIAARLFISAKTVHHHVSAVLAKLGAANRTAAAAKARRLGLVDAAGRAERPG